MRPQAGDFVAGGDVAGYTDYPVYDAQRRHCERSEAIQNRIRRNSLDCFVAIAPRNDDGERQWPNQPSPPASHPANACAARSPSRSTCPRAGPGTTIPHRAAARMARPTPPMSAAGASASASSKARLWSRATRTRRPAPRAVSVRPAARHCSTNAAARRTWSTSRARLFSGRTGRQPLYHIAIEELQEWAYTGEPLVPLKGFPGVVWQRSRKKRRAAGEDPFELSREDG